MKLSSLIGSNQASASEPITVDNVSGEAVVRVESAVPTQSSTGNDMIKLSLRVVSGPSAAVNRKAYDFLVFSDNPDAMDFLIDRMGALGLLSAPLLEQDNIELVAEAAAGRSARVILGGETWKGRVQIRVKQWIEPVDTSGGFPTTYVLY